MAMAQPGRAGRTTSRTRGRPRTRGPREDPDDGFQSFPAEAPGEKRRRAAGELRRPLQPGPPVLRQPDAGRAAAHRRRLRVRAEQGASGPTSASGWSPTCATSTRTSPQQIADGLGLDRAARPRRRRPRRPITDLAAVAGAEHRRQRARDASPAARSACSSPTAPTAASCRRSSTRRAPRGRSSRWWRPGSAA